MAGTTNKYISEEEYHALMEHFGSLTEKQKKIVYEVMVLKKTQSEVASAMVISRQSVYQLVGRIWKAYQKSMQLALSTKGVSNLPEGWEIMTVAAPDFMWRTFLQEIRDYMRKNKITGVNAGVDEE
jgi:predicted DNA-binding protein YlxM (UPF0122 family)